MAGTGFVNLGLVIFELYLFFFWMKMFNCSRYFALIVGNCLVTGESLIECGVSG